MQNGLIKSALLMMAALVLLIWIPISYVGPFAAGIIGGSQAKNLQQAIVAALMVILALPVALFATVAVVGSSLVGGLAALAILLVLFLKSIALVTGAVDAQSISGFDKRESLSER